MLATDEIELAMPRTQKREDTREAPPLDRPSEKVTLLRKNGGQTYSKRGEATFERVMRIVATMYRERGYERSSMSALARRAGLTAPAIYHYFGSKEEILAAFLDYTLRDLHNSVEAGIRGKTASAKLKSFMKALVRWQLQQTPFPEAYDRIFELGQLRNSLPDTHRKHILDLERQFFELCRGIVEEGVKTGEFRNVPIAPTVFAIIAMGDYILGWYRPEGSLSQTQIADCYADLVLAMVKHYGED
jgi:AcrR family transcriptional regulator